MHKYSKVKLSDQFIVDLESILGKGSTGCVYEGTNIKNSSKVAVKVIELSKIDNQVTQYLLEMEKIALMQLSSAYVLRGLKVIQDQKYCFMVTEHCNGGTLKKYIQEKARLSQQTAFQLIKCILLGYQNLVDKKILHRDLKPANIMIHNMNPKIIDFGYCEIAGYPKPKLEYNVGSPSYMAPQSYRFNIYSQKSEIWSIGVIYYECVTGRTLDQGAYMEDVFKLLENNGIPYPDHISYRTRHLINAFLKTNPHSRPTCSDLLQSFFQHESPAKSPSLFFNVNTYQTVTQQRKTLNISQHDLKKQYFSRKQTVRNLNNQIKIESLNKNDVNILNRDRTIYSAYQRSNQPQRVLKQKENERREMQQRKTMWGDTNKSKHNPFRFTSLFENISQSHKETIGKQNGKDQKLIQRGVDNRERLNYSQNVQRAIKLVRNQIKGVDVEWERKKMHSYRT